jgi:hypothetical protein
MVSVSVDVVKPIVESLVSATLVSPLDLSRLRSLKLDAWKRFSRALRLVVMGMLKPILRFAS